MDQVKNNPNNSQDIIRGVYLIWFLILLAAILYAFLVLVPEKKNANNMCLELGYLEVVHFDNEGIFDKIPDRVYCTKKFGDINSNNNIIYSDFNDRTLQGM